MKNAIALLLSLGCLTGCAETSAETRPNVVLICLDTVRADRLGCYGYGGNPTTPAIDSLATRSLVFRDTSSVAGWTKPSVPSFMTGTYPIQHGVYEGSARGQVGKVSDVLPEAAETLAEVFSSRSYQTAAIIENAQLRLGNGFEQGFDSYDDRGGSAREIRWKARDWIEQRDPGLPFFLYLHFLDAHWPFDVPDEYSTKFAEKDSVSIFQGKESRVLRDAINHGKRKLSDAELASLNALYDGSIRYIDDELGLFFRSLEQAGLDENTVICVIADHGEEFLEHGRVGHGHGLWDNLLSVPWILKAPQLAPQEINLAVSLVDLFPTLLAAAGILAPESHEGVDRIANPLAERPVLAEHKEPRAYVQSVRAGERKLVRRAAPLQLGESERTVPIGTAWEIQFTREGAGTAHALDLQPGEAESDELELKARITEIDGEELRVGGVRVRCSEATVFYGEILSAVDLAVGLPIKIKGTFRDDVLLARRVKGYSPDLRFEEEVRGRVTETNLKNGVGTLKLGALEIQVNAETHWDLPKPYLKREALAEFASAADAEFQLNRNLFNLSSDRAELNGDERGDAALESEMQQLFSDLARTRLWSQADRRALDREAVEALRGLGYVK